jgi:hypothetical protein
MNRLARPITPDEVRAYQISGVVHLRGILDLGAVNLLRRCIDEAVATLNDSASGYNLTSLTSAVERGDAETLRAQSNGQHDVAAIVEYIKQSGKPLLLDQRASAEGAFFLDTGVAARHRNFHRFCAQGVVPEIAGALLGSDRVNFFGDQIFIKELEHADIRHSTRMHPTLKSKASNVVSCGFRSIPLPRTPAG